MTHIMPKVCILILYIRYHYKTNNAFHLLELAGQTGQAVKRIPILTTPIQPVQSIQLCSAVMGFRGNYEKD